MDSTRIAIIVVVLIIIVGGIWYFMSGSDAPAPAAPATTEAPATTAPANP